MPESPYHTKDHAGQQGIPFFLQAGQGKPAPAELLAQRSAYHGDQKEQRQQIPFFFNEDEYLEKLIQYTRMANNDLNKIRRNAMQRLHEEHSWEKYRETLQNIFK